MTKTKDMQMLFVPELGTLLTLWGPWEFTLYPEHRNKQIGEKLGHWNKGYWEIDGQKYSYNAQKRDPLPADWQTRANDKELWEVEWRWVKTWKVTLPPDTILRIDRIYIRKGNKEFSSMSFWVKNGEYKGCRFWAKLSECNEIIYK